MSGEELSRRWRLLSPSRLRTVRAVVDHGSIRAAAEALGCTTSSVYQHLSVLEKGLGTTLLGARAPRVAPTDAGRRLTEHARELLDRLERVEQEMAEFGAAQRGTVRVVADAAVAERLLVPLMVRAAKDRPLVEVRVEVASATDDTAALVRRVREARCDLALGGRHAFEPRPAAAGLDVLDLGLADLRVVLHAGHPGADGGTVDPAVLAGERWVTGPAGSASERCLLELCAAAGFCPDVGYRSTSWPLALGLVRAGRATTLTTRALSGEDGSVAVRRLSGETGRHHLLAVTRRDPDPATAYGLHVVRAALDAETAAETAGSA